jgi:hypothetical protein
VFAPAALAACTTASALAPSTSIPSALLSLTLFFAAFFAAFCSVRVACLPGVFTGVDLFAVCVAKGGGPFPRFFFLLVIARIFDVILLATRVITQSGREE